MCKRIHKEGRTENGLKIEDKETHEKNSEKRKGKQNARDISGYQICEHAQTQGLPMHGR